MGKVILIVDDEQDLVATLEFNLQREGYTVASAFNGTDALARAEQDPKPDLILLDLMLPDLMGTEVCRRLRSNPATKDTPIIMLTARGEEIDRVVGFEVGADDYVTKPFSVREVVLRVSAILRRTDPPEDAAREISFGVLRIDRGGHRVWVENEEVQLTALEFRLLDTFVARKGRVQSRDVLLSDVWGIAAVSTTRTVDTHVKRLREKLGVAGQYIETTRGVGYRFRDLPDSIAS